MNIFKFYKKYKELNTILKWIKRAKKEYIKRNFEGMCVSFSFTSKEVKLKGRDKESEYILFRDIHRFIPEFNPEFLNASCANPYNINHSYWWPIWDRQARIKAFDKLIDLYNEKLGR